MGGNRAPCCAPNMDGRVSSVSLNFTPSAKEREARESRSPRARPLQCVCSPIDGSRLRLLTPSPLRKLELRWPESSPLRTAAPSAPLPLLLLLQHHQPSSNGTLSAHQTLCSFLAIAGMFSLHPLASTSIDLDDADAGVVGGGWEWWLAP